MEQESTFIQAEAIEELCSSHLLQRLRDGYVAGDSITEDEERGKMDLILHHRSQFPTKLRTVISESSTLEPTDFLNEIYQSSRALFFGRPGPESNTNGLHPSEEVESQEPKPPFHWWHGLDSDVDTEDEVELLIRLFPKLLSEKQRVSPLSSFNNCYPIYVLLVCSKSLSFIPLFAELGTELGSFQKEERAGLTCFMKNVIVRLVWNSLLRDKRDERPSFEALDATNAQILRRLKDRGLIFASDIYELDLVNLLLDRSMLISEIQAEKRLRFLLDWDPLLLKDCGDGGNLLRRFLLRLQDFIVNRTSPHRKIRSKDFERFLLLLELGMAHFPKSLGFVFHNESLNLACEMFGTQKVNNAIDNEIRRTLVRMKSRQNNSSSNYPFQILFLVAVTDENISLDGIYTLFRSDPIALLLV